MILKFIIYGQPTSKKNSMQFIHSKGRIIPIPSAKYRQWIKAAKAQIAPLIGGADDIPIEGRVWVEAIAYRHTHRKLDLTNMLSAVDDMLEELGILVDDAQVYSHDGSRIVFDVPKEEARVEITIRDESEKRLCPPGQKPGNE